MHLFWEQGYNATSTPELLDAMGVGRGSFYAAFEDKQSLFNEALDLFAERNKAVLRDVMITEGPLQAVRRFFEITLFEVPRRRVRRGCLLVNTVLELAAVEESLRARATAHLNEMEALMAECFREAIARGELATDRSPEQLASVVMTMNQGLRVASRKHASHDELRDVLDTTLSLLGFAA